MCRTFQIAKDTVKEYILKKEPFYYKDLQEEIINRNGVLRVAPGVSIVSYLKTLERRNIIYYNQFLNKYDFVEYVTKPGDYNFAELSAVGFESWQL